MTDPAATPASAAYTRALAHLDALLVKIAARMRAERKFRLIANPEALADLEAEFEAAHGRPGTIEEMVSFRYPNLDFEPDPENGDG
jgi:hypothetical protein